MAGTIKSVDWLQGQRVAVAGKLATMTRREVARLVESHGGIFSRGMHRSATILIVGRDGWPLGADGRPTRKLRRALALADKGLDIQIVPEEELLSRLHPFDGPFERHATLCELAEMLGTSTDRLNAWLKSGLISPVETVDGICYFDFCQVAGAKSLCDLIRSGITTARLRQSLHQLQAWLGSVEHPLALLKLLENPRKLVVRLSGGQLAEPSGQLLFDFSPTAASLPVSVPWQSEDLSAEQWFAKAYEAEQNGKPAEAARAYQQALLAGGPAFDACFNLANALYEMREYARAGERYRQALELDPHAWEARNNLGTVLTQEGELEEALAAYGHALRLNPHYADSHYNVADTLEELGRFEEASEHWEAYLQLEPHGPWAEHARDRLSSGD